MCIYWRVQTDLHEFGDALVLHHPNLVREFKNWVKKNTGGLSLANAISLGGAIRLCLSPN